jgi:CRISPR-associated protein Cmr2
MNYLFLVNIGPVQDFIASARRSRDLFFGSWLLSELSKAAAKRIVDDKGILIFPAPDLQIMPDALNPGNELNVANKILAVIEGEPDELGVQYLV